MSEIKTLNWITQICKEPHGLGSSFNSAYYPFRIPTNPNVRAVSRRGKPRISSANCVQFTCCVLVTVANRELRNVVFKDHTNNSSLCQHKPNPAFMFHCTCVSGTPLTWPQQHNWLRRPGGLCEWWSWNGVQSSSCGSNKYVKLTYLAKNSINESIQRVSDEGNRRNANTEKFCLSE